MTPEMRTRRPSTSSATDAAVTGDGLDGDASRPGAGAARADRALREPIVDRPGHGHQVGAREGARIEEDRDATGGIGDEAAAVGEGRVRQRRRLDGDRCAVHGGPRSRNADRRGRRFRRRSRPSRGVGPADGVARRRVSALSAQRASDPGEGGDGEGGRRGRVAIRSSVGPAARVSRSPHRCRRCWCLTPRSRPAAVRGSSRRAGRAPACPSIHVDEAVPQPTASMAVVAPRIRSATLPPVAAMPLAYRASAIAANTPASWATSTWPRAGTLGAPRLHAVQRLIVLPVAVT